MIRAVSFALFCAALPVTASGDVFEFTRDGRVTVQRSSGPAPHSQKQPAATLAVRTPASRAAYRAMAEQTALRHAGGAGPRHAGLDALTFSRFFVELIRTESGFNPRALSPKGAQGLGQLMPGTARLLGVRDAWDPAQNLDGAARYFSAQLARFGDVSLALAAYNAGPHRVIQYRGVPPYRETRAYVAKIVAATGARPAPPPAPSATPEPLPVALAQKDISVWQY